MNPCDICNKQPINQAYFKLSHRKICKSCHEQLELLIFSLRDEINIRNEEIMQ